VDIADATLLIIAERENIDDILSIDRDFSIYKTARGRVLNNLLK
jgi:uncharacterized protein